MLIRRAEITQCKAAIREMTESARDRGRFAPVKEYNDLQMKVKRLGQESQRIQHEIGSVNRARKDSNRLQITQCFISAAKSTLPEDQFTKLLTMAHEMAGLAK